MIPALPAILSRLAPMLSSVPIWAVLVLAGFGGTYWLGWDHAATRYQNNQLKVSEEHYRKLLRDYWTVRASVNDLERQLEQSRAKTRIIKQEVKVYVEPDKDQLCGPSNGIVGLLNDARNPAVPVAPAEPVDTGRAASGISYTEQVEDTLDITERYNALMLKHNALISWIEAHYGAQPK